MEKLINIDRRIIYILLTISVALPLLKPMGLPFGLSKETQRAFDAVEALKPGDAVVIDFGYNAGGAAEVHPMAAAFVAHCMIKDVRVIGFSLDPQGSRFADLIWQQWAEQGKTYGEDFVSLGYFAGGEAALASFAKDIPGFVSTDYYGNSTSGMPIFQGIKTADDIDLFISISTSSILPFIQYFHGPYGKPVTGGAIGTQISRYQSYADAGQLQGYLASLRGAAEYEKLLEMPGEATSAMDAQSAAHILLAVLIVLGNIGEYVVRKTQQASSEESERRA
ncbi:MAG TPA: hypothetical protein PLF60_07670 [Bacillota bacterium]|nr:hypothetical protein [Bacillota bacterium]HPT34895.1 hypothetical protein [Bacillota bacterium]